MPAETHVLRLFVTAPGTRDEPRPKPVEHASVTVTGNRDGARLAAKKLLEGQGYKIRSLNWGPAAHPAQPVVLIAYVEKT